MTLRLTPAGHLCWESTQETSEVAESAPLRAAFQQDWRAGLFALGAGNLSPGAPPCFRYWREMAQLYLAGLCRIPEETGATQVEPLAQAEYARLLLVAPPMRGGEYLSEEVLQAIWAALDNWAQEAINAEGGLAQFIQARAPRWHQVGRVCFHLAENKKDESRPFAFMATYTTGMGTGGRLKHVPLRQALEEYSGKKDRPALVKLLSPVHRAAQASPWLKDMVDSGEVYQATAWPVKRAYQFLKEIPTLEESGLTVRIPDWWRKRSRPQVAVTIGEQKRTTLGAEALLDFDVSVAVGDAKLSRSELKSLLKGQDGLVFFKGQWIEVDRAKLEEALKHWEQVQSRTLDGQLSFIEGMRLLAGASSDLKHEVEVEQERQWVHVCPGKALQEILACLRTPAALDELKSARNLRGTLRPYQKEGAAWLHFLTSLGLGACLADDMGLGKTIQVLALLAHTHAAQKPGKPSLLVVPSSLMGNWRQEAERFTPSLRLFFVHPAETPREALKEVAASPEKYLADADLVVTTYSMLTRHSWLAEHDWRLLILDEAQAIKNPGARQTKAVKELPAQGRIALTGTPVENRLGDLWSLFDFLNPGLLGSTTAFKAFVKSLQQRSENQYAPLRRLASPYILRRLKTDRTIISDLPKKIETTRYCTLTKTQVALYKKTVQSMKDALESAENMARRGLVLQTLMRLKQICNHPAQLKGDGHYEYKASGKFLRIQEICAELAERQEKVLVFTQFQEIIAPLEEHLAACFGRGGLVLHGGTSVKRRKDIVSQFQEENGPPFFILSLKAGGTGLNLTAASHVIHFDRWWNPAVENQATDRAFRIGQKRNVLVHKFVTRGTVEERIAALIEEKREMAEQLIGGGEVNLTELPDDEILRLVSLDVTRAAV